MSAYADVSGCVLGEATFRNVLAVVDGPRDAAHVLDVAVPIVSESHGRLTLLTAIVAVPPLAYAGASWIGETGSLIHELERWSADLLARTVRGAPAGMVVQTVLTREALQKAVPDQIRRRGHDLVIISAPAASRCGTGARVRRWCHLTPLQCDVPIVLVTDGLGQQRGMARARRGHP